MLLLERHPAGTGTGPSPVPEAFHLATGLAMVVAAALLASVARPADSWPRLAVMAVTVAGFAMMTAAARVSAAVAGIGFLVTNGFLVNRYGQLSWHGGADLARVVILAASAALGLTVAALRTRARRRRARQSQAQHGTAPVWEAKRHDGCPVNGRLVS